MKVDNRKKKQVSNVEKAIRQREHVEAKCTKISDNVSSEQLLGGRFFLLQFLVHNFPLMSKTDPVWVTIQHKPQQHCQINNPMERVSTTLFTLQ